MASAESVVATSGSERLCELVRLAMELRFNGKAHSPDARLEKLQKVQRMTRRTAREMLADDDDDDSSGTDKLKDSIDDLLLVDVSPPRAFFSFRGNGRMHLPLIDWSGFRGYSMAFWIRIGPSAMASFELYRSTNASATLGVDATLEWDDQNGAVLMVRSCAPHGTDQKRNHFGAAVVAAMTPAVTNAPSSDWRQVSHRIQVRRHQWHLLVITHSLHYVKKSRVACFVDACPQFSEELIYPSGLVQATKTTLGGGSGGEVRVSSATMYHEELPPTVIEAIFLQGPSVSLFRRWISVPFGAVTEHMVDLRESTVLSPFGTPMENVMARTAALNKLQVVFSFSAHDDIQGHEDIFADRSVEWIVEGIAGSKGKWVSLENVNATSEVLQRNARLGKNVLRTVRGSDDLKATWNRLLGVEAVPVLVDYLLTAAEELLRDEALISDGEQMLSLQATVEKVMTDMLCILRGLLLNHARNVHQVLRNYLLHQFYHAIHRHTDMISSAWTPTNVVACVDTVKSTLRLMPWSLHDTRDLNHPAQPSVWSWNPTFATAVRAWLLDYRAWSCLDFKTQSIFHHQLYSLACEYPKLLNDLNVVSRLLESLSLHFLTAPHRQPSKGKGGTSTQNSKYSADADKEQHWKLQCIQTVMETLEVCLMNQSVYVREAMEQEIVETTFAKASDANPGPAPVAPSVSPALSNPSEGETGRSVAAMQRRKGGVFFINLENIIWSDQSSANQPSFSENRGNLGSETKAEDGSADASVMPNVQIRFSLLRDIRSVVRFLAACPDHSVCVALLQLLRRLSVAYLDLRFGLISSNVVDVLLLLMRSSSKPQASHQGKFRGYHPTNSASSAEVRMACVPLLIYLLDWLESVEGRTVWCGLEEHLRSVLNGEGNYTRGFLELMMEFYFDPAGLSGVQQSIVMNDPSKRESVLFPISPIHGSKPQNSSIHDSGIVVMSDDGFRSESDASSVDTSAGGNGLGAWIKAATGFCGKKLSLSWEKRVQVVRMAALRSLTPMDGSQDGQVDGEKSSPTHRDQQGAEEGLVMNVYDKAVSGILVLPLRSILPFLPALLVNTSVNVRDRVLMEISVKLKTDYADQDHQILMMKRDWIEALLELFVVCNDGRGELPAVECEAENSSEVPVGRRVAHRPGAFSFDAHKTGEDLVVDVIVSLLCGAMQHPRGWRAFVDLIAALKIMQRKYSPSKADGVSQADTASSSIPAVLGSNSNIHLQLALLAHPLDWLSQITGIVLQKMARSRIILSKVLTENVHKVFILVQEALLATAHQHCPPTVLSDSQVIPQRASGRYVWSDAQVFLLNAVLDMCTRLVDSTHKVYRTGLVPGLQILQSSLSYVPPDGAALVERTTGVMERAFQQELNTASAVRVYDNVTPREVFLSALVCLRRALLVQQGSSTSSKDGESDMCAALQLLILKLCTSEVFLEDLHNNELSVHVLSDMSEQSAVAAVLNALGAIMNETEMHEREEEADLVPLFPTVRELRRLDQAEEDGRASESGIDLDPDPFAIAFAGTTQTAKTTQSFDDDIERSLWAALEVEENRMLETLKEAITREKKRFERIGQVAIPQKDVWTRRLWDFQEYKFRSQHAHSFLSSTVASAILQEYARRIGVYEAPFPARSRRPYELDLPFTDEQRTPSTENGVRKASDADSRRRRFSLPLEVHGLGDGRPKANSSDGQTHDIDEEGQMLLERVGRVIAAQGGGEIQDITSESTGPVDGSGQRTCIADDAAVNQSIAGSGSPGKGEQEPHNTDEDLDQLQEVQDAASARSISSLPNTLRTANLPSSLWHVDAELHKESGLDPSEGVALAPGEQIVAQAKCRRVIPEGMVNGNLYFCPTVLVFVPVNPPHADTESTRVTSDTDESAPGQRRCWRWKYKHLSAVFLRRFRLRDSAIEIFLQNGSCHFIDFPQVVKQQRNELVRLLYSFLPRSVPKQWPGRAAGSSLSAITKAWQNRQISNFDYLMALNTYAGRSFNDLTQYPVFPWVIKNYESDVLDLSDPHNFRDLSKPIGALNPERLQEFWDRYNSFDDPIIPKFLYGSHYSTCAGVVLFFLVRLQPFANLHRKMQGGTFDLPDRLFYSIRETWNMCNSQMSEVKELTPEFYCDPGFLKNNNFYEFGKRHDHIQVKDVMLPPWAKESPEEFVRLHRAALESEYVSQHLHEWVDLIFGFKQRGKAALKANNVFYYLTYYGVVDLDRIEDPFIRESMELQIAHFGQCPMQLFSSPHPKRNSARRVIGLGPAVPQLPVSSTVSNVAVTQASGLVSPVVKSPVAASPAIAGSTNVAKPLSSMFQDPSPSAQEQRRHWSPAIVVKPLATSAVRWIKIYPDRFLTVNELGVVELYNWKLTPKSPLVPSGPSETSTVPPQTTVETEIDVTSDPGTPAPPLESSNYDLASIPAPSITIRASSDSEVKPFRDSMEGDTAIEHLETTTSQRVVCPWLLEVARDDSPFDVVPRIPVFEDASSSKQGFFPIVASMNGRVLISGGAPNGSIQLRMLDLDNGHVIAKASVTGHDAAVTCLSVDRFSYHNAPLGNHQTDGDEILVSGSKDMTLSVWRLSRTKPDLLFRPPRVSSSPIMILRGHKFPLVDCCINTYLNVVASCSSEEALIHYLHDDGSVAFGFRADDVHNGAAFVGIETSSKGFIVALVRWVESRSLTTSSACVVYNLAGTAVLIKIFEGEDMSRLQLSQEGDLAILTLGDRGVIRMCRLDDFVVVQEYETPAHVNAPICVATFGPDEATVLAISGHTDGSIVLHLLPDADGSVSLLANLRRFLGVNSKLKMVKGTVQQAQNLAWTTLGNAKAVTSTARDIAGEAIGEAKSIVKGFITYLRQGPGPGPGT